MVSRITCASNDQTTRLTWILIVMALVVAHDDANLSLANAACRDDNGSDVDAETASQRSIPLSPPRSPHRLTSPLRAQDLFSIRDSQVDSIEIDFSSETDEVSESHSDPDPRRASSITSTAPSTSSQPELSKTHHTSATYPPTFPSVTVDVDSASTYSRKARPESMLLQPPRGPLVLGIALVDFNHLVRLARHDIHSSCRPSDRLAPRSNSAKVISSRTRRSRKYFLFSHFRTGLIWCAPSVTYAYQISSCRTVFGRLFILPSRPRCVKSHYDIWNIVSFYMTHQKMG